MPRATTAAWLVMPPRVVRMPLAACMPWMSSGLVSMRTRMTVSPLAARASASSAREHHACRRPHPGEAGRPFDSSLRGALGSSVGCSSWSSAAGFTRLIASVSVDQPFARHVDRDLQRGGGGALPVAGLQHVQLVLLHRELDVLHVRVVLLELGADRDELLVGAGMATSMLRSPGLALSWAIGCGVRMPATTSSPCALIRYSP